ncbi:type II toxin-antitoxin system PemK/MazF family toxin [Neolewinella litorea]|uniref:mRNA interferase n=1 Tax=Neolewinella litorea TaxID=2562452 RepID=A0A4S4N713_9BACT|nr:type II toxin-antitoxin system PemK/MazF family toxin [Neolewinella litorea]THH34934.1 type II toxin-antitoxin system PemK/MazF family toxin [Neolewinella litorea]
MKRGEIWLINLDPTIGAEIAKKRPALIVSANGVGKLPLRIVAPITNWKEHYRLVPWMVPLPGDDRTGLEKASSADCFQVRSISEKRMIRRIGEVTEEQLVHATDGLRAVLGLSD